MRSATGNGFGPRFTFLTEDKEQASGIHRLGKAVEIPFVLIVISWMAFFQNRSDRQLRPPSIF
jgi:hypothetical protein